jgi:hypothetical protein
VRIKQNLVKNSKETHYGIHPRERKDKGNRYNMIGVRKNKGKECSAGKNGKHRIIDKILRRKRTYSSKFVAAH